MAEERKHPTAEDFMRNRFALKQKLNFLTVAALARCGVGVAVFWTLTLAVGAWLVGAGLWPAAVVLLAVWLVFALPGLYVQARVILDGVRFFMLHKPTRIAPRIMNAQGRPEYEHWVQRLAGRAVQFASATSPLTPIAASTLLALCEHPEAVQKKSQDAVYVMRCMRHAERSSIGRFFAHPH